MISATDCELRATSYGVRSAVPLQIRCAYAKGCATGFVRRPRMMGATEFELRAPSYRVRSAVPLNPMAPTRKAVLRGL